MEYACAVSGIKDIVICIARTWFDIRKRITATIVLMAQLLLYITVSIDKLQIKLYNVKYKVISLALNTM